MPKMTYAEQLKHPNWQKKRLERLQAAEWSCRSCGTKEKTLHVHHRRYIKGRLAWEYEDDNFDVLCEDCHAEDHELREAVHAELAKFETFELPMVQALLAGYRNGLVASQGVPDEYADTVIQDDGDCAKAYWSGQVARLFDDLSEEQVGEVYSLFITANPAGFADYVASALTDCLAKARN